MLKKSPEHEQEIVDRDILAERRRRLLYPDSCLQLSRLWPPPPTTLSSRKKAESARVGVVVVCPPDPGGYDPVPRHTAELVSALVRNGVTPTFLDLSSRDRCKETAKIVKTFWSKVVYQLVEKPDVSGVRGPIGLAAKRAYRLYEWLKHQSFDVVHSPDIHGCLYFCQRAREQGLAFADTRFVVHPVNGLLQLSMLEYQSLDQIQKLPRIYLESSTLELADTVPLPGRQSLSLLLNSGMEFVSGQIEHYPIPFDPGSGAGDFAGIHQAGNAADIKRILCLPGDSPRGISLFCKALKRGFPGKTMPFSVGFGVPDRFRKEFKAFISQLTSDWGKSPVVHTVQDRDSLAKILLQEPDTLCVLPVVNGWNRYQLLELIAAGVRVLVADKGAVTEILSGEENMDISCAHLPDAIGRGIRARIEKNFVSAPKLDIQEQIPASWVTPVAARPRPETSGESPLVTVCLMHFERPQLVEQALASVLEQTYTNFEVVLVDDGSLKEESLQKLEELKVRFQNKGWQVICQQNRYLGAARNTGALAASGRYLYFLDDDNVLKPHALETLVKVAEHMKADVVAALSDAFEGDQPPDSSAFASRRIMQVGDDLAYGLYRNAFGDSNALVRRSTYLALGGNTEDYAVGKDDMEFFARAVLNSCKLTVIPEALFWARQMPTRLRNLHFNPHAGNIRVLRAYLPHIPRRMRPVLLLAAGLVESSLEGRNITFKAYLLGRAKRLARTRLGAWLRYAFLGPLKRRLREWRAAGK